MTIRMRLIIAFSALLLCSGAATQPRPELELSYEQATSIWAASKDRADFREYLDAFTQWNNEFQLDSRHGCFDKGKEPITLLLVITDRAVIEPVFSSVGGAKAECFRMSYLGLEVGKPPYTPLGNQNRTDSAPLNSGVRPKDNMVEVSGKTFYDRAKDTLFENMSISNCIFEGCYIPRQADEAWTIIRNVKLRDVTNINCSIDKAIVEDVELTNLKKLGRCPLFFWGCLFCRVTLTGKISGIKFNRSVRANPSKSEQDAWDDYAKRFYSQVDWALDISRAQFGGSISFEALPGDKIRIDPTSQALVSREAMRLSNWRQLDFLDTSFHISLSSFEDSIFDFVVLSAAHGGKNKKQELEVLAMLRREGIAR